MLYEGMRKIDLIRFNQYAQCTAKIKGVAPTHQYVPIPNYAVQQASESYGKVLVQSVRDGKRILRQLAINVIIHYC